jgi:hypothetical protein
MADPLLEDVVSGLQHSIDTTFGADPDTLSTRQVDTKDGSVLDLNPGGGVRTSPEVFVDFSEVDDGSTNTRSTDASATQALNIAGSSNNLLFGTDGTLGRGYLKATDGGGNNAPIDLNQEIKCDRIASDDSTGLELVCNNGNTRLFSENGGQVEINELNGPGGDLQVFGDSNVDGSVFTSEVENTSGDLNLRSSNRVRVEATGGDNSVTIRPSSNSDLAIINSDGVSPYAFPNVDDIGINANSNNLFLLHSDGSACTVEDNQGNGNGVLQVNGTKPFIVRDEANGRTIRHACVESNLGTQCLYRFNVTTKKGVAKIELPDYFSWLNFDDAHVFCQADKHFGMAYGEIARKNASSPVEGESGGDLTIKSNQDGPYSVMIVVSRDVVWTEIEKPEGNRIKEKMRKSHMLGKRKMEE